MTTPESHIYDDLEQVIADVEANATRLHADAETERAKGDARNPSDEHTIAAAKLDWDASQCERAVAMYHSAVAQLRAHRGPAT